MILRPCAANRAGSRNVLSSHRELVWPGPRRPPVQPCRPRRQGEYFMEAGLQCAPAAEAPWPAGTGRGVRTGNGRRDSVTSDPWKAEAGSPSRSRSGRSVIRAEATGKPALRVVRTRPPPDSWRRTIASPERSSASLSASMTTPSSSIRTSGSTVAAPGTACSGRLKCHRRADAGNAGGAPAPLTSRESGESGRLREGHDLTGVQVGRLRTGPRMSMGRTPVSATQAWRSRWVTSCSNTWKSVPAIVDIGRRRDYGFSRSQKDRRAGQIRTARQQHVRYRWLQFAGRFGGGVPKPGLSQDGDGAGDRTGWPAVIRGRPAAEPVNACAVPSSEVSEQQPR